MLVGISMDKIFSDIANFLETNKEEIIIITFGDFSGFDKSNSSHSVFASKIESTLGKWILPPSVGLNITYKRMVQCVFCLFWPMWTPNQCHSGNHSD